MKHISTLCLNDTGVAALDKGKDKEDVLAQGLRVYKIILQAIVHEKLLISVIYINKPQTKFLR